MSGAGGRILARAVVLVVLGLAGMRVGTAAGYPGAASLLHRSITSMQHTVHEVHSVGVIRTESCCPRKPALLRLTGDCVTQSNVYALSATVQGAMSFDGKSIEAVDFHYIVRSSHAPASIGVWTRSSATHNTWQKATQGTFSTRNLDLMVYLCPSILQSELAQHFPTHLVNLGPVNVHGVSAWRLQDRSATTRGGFKGTVLQSDWYLAHSSLYWLQYRSLYSNGTVKQRVMADYSRLNVPVTITAPAIGSSLP